MRKWMSERFKRRKKPAEKSSADAGPAPLQPKYFEAGEASAAPAAEAHEPSPEPAAEEAQPSQDSAPTADARAAAPPQSGDDARRGRRRRRGRGGRGRNGSGARTAATASTMPPPVAPEQTAPAEAAPAQPAKPVAPKGTVVLAIGLPGSGKSTWFKRHSITPLSSDLLRSILFDDPTEQRFQDLIFSNLRSMLKARLIARRPVNYVDATNLTPHERKNWISLAHDYAYDVQAVYFDVPLDVCLERNQRRERVVPEDVMRRMASKLKAPGFEEGFSKITVVKVKKKENVPAGEEARS